MQSFEVVTEEWFRAEATYIVDASSAEEACRLVIDNEVSYEDYEKPGEDDIFGRITSVTEMASDRQIKVETRPDPHFVVNGCEARIGDVTVIKQLTETAWIEVKLTSEGVIIDVWQDDEVVATSSQMYDEVASELAGDDIFDEEEEDAG